MTARPAAASSALSGPDGEVTAAFESRTGPMLDFTEQAGDVVAACHAMAVRFHQGGKLVVFGTGGPSTDARMPSTSPWSSSIR